MRSMVDLRRSNGNATAPVVRCKGQYEAPPNSQFSLARTISDRSVKVACEVGNASAPTVDASLISVVLPRSTWRYSTPTDTFPQTLYSTPAPTTHPIFVGECVCFWVL